MANNDTQTMRAVIAGFMGHRLCEKMPLISFVIMLFVFGSSTQVLMMQAKTSSTSKKATLDLQALFFLSDSVPITLDLGMHIIDVQNFA